MLITILILSAGYHAHIFKRILHLVILKSFSITSNPYTEDHVKLATMVKQLSQDSEHRQG